MHGGPAGGDIQRHWFKPNISPSQQLLRGRRGHFLFLDRHGAFAYAFAKVSELRATNRALAFHFDLVHARRMHREHALDTLAVADAADGEHFVQATSAFADHHAGENLDALFVAFDHLRVHAHRVTASMTTIAGSAPLVRT